MKESVNIYISTCCNVEASKPPCVKPKAQPKPKKGKGKRGEQREKAPEFATLGSWTCTSCHKPCKVTVSLRPPKQEAANERKTSFPALNLEEIHV